MDEPTDRPATQMTKEGTLVWTERQNDPTCYKAWTPVVPAAMFYFGQALTHGTNDAPTMLIAAEHPAFAPAVGYQRRLVALQDGEQEGEREGFTSNGSNLTAWLPLPPSEVYVALGVVWTTDGHSPPTVGRLRCVHQDMIQSGLLKHLMLDGKQVPINPFLARFGVVPGLGVVAPGSGDAGGLKGLTFLEEDILEQGDDLTEEEACHRAECRHAWEGMMPAMSCSEEESMSFNLGHEPFKYPSPGGYMPLAAAVGTAEALAAASATTAAVSPTLPLSIPTMAMQVFHPERGVWEDVQPSHDVSGTDQHVNTDTSTGNNGDRLMGRFHLSTGRGDGACNSVFPLGPLKVDGEAPPSPFPF